MGQLASAKGLSRIILVTTAWHMPRAMMLFRQTDLRITPFPVGQLTNPTAPVTILDFLPQGSALAHAETTLREFLGAGYYSVRGRI
jgi:uncharacterized SAM-binding protein YcdF (DUF218 family)